MLLKESFWRRDEGSCGTEDVAGWRRFMLSAIAQANIIKGKHPASRTMRA